MKKVVKFIILAIILSLFMFQGTVQAFEITMTSEKSNLSEGDEFIYTISSSAKVVATNFMINYDSNSFELVGAVTEGLNVAVKNGKIACIYADMSGVGTDKFQIKFKVKDKISSKDSSFTIEDAKFREVGQDESYTDSRNNWFKCCNNSSLKIFNYY